MKLPKFLNRFIAWSLVASTAFAAETDDLSRLQSAFLPKREIGQPEFLKANPEWDGRGVVIAIFDSGVDPRAAGMAVTTTGERKVLDILDASGSGDVDTRQSVELNEDGSLPGLSGRDLILPDGIVNPSGEFRVGLKRASDIFPRQALNRLKTHEASIRKAELSQIRAERALQQRDEDRGFLDKAPEDQTLDEQDRAIREQLLEALEDSSIANQAPIYFDCVLWHDGEHWMVLIDTNRDANLTDETLLRPYRVAGETGVFDPVSNLTFGVQVYEEGDLLSIVTVNDPHGTHVAAIAAAHDPENPDRNGIAPGAQIVSIRLGDHRVGGSIGDSERRAVALAAQAGVDIVNASWGGTSYYQDGMDEGSQSYDMLVERYGILTILSAGNDGPALSTLGSAGGEARRVLGVGAYVSSEMGEVLYSTLEQNGESSLQFSSRGPSKDGDWGVDVTAPGAALSSYSGESLRGFEMSNGTSMSSPSVAGMAALLISAGKQEGLAIDPARVRAAIMLGSRWIEEEALYTQGRGLVNVPGAWEKLKAIQGEPAFGAFYDLEVTRGSFSDAGRGLYVREPDPDERLRVIVDVSPAWIEAVTAEEKVAFDSAFNLESTVEWIEVPSFFHLANGTNHFIAHVSVPEDAGDLGKLYTAEIKATLVGKEDLGPVFTVPVTVLRGTDPSEDLDEPFKATLSMSPGHTERLFFSVPEGADHLDVKLKHIADDPIARLYIFHGMTLAQEWPIYNSGDPVYVRPEEGEERELRLPTIGGQVMELTVYQFWSSVGPSTLELEFEWIGLGLEAAPMVFKENQGWATLPIQSLKDEELTVAASIDRAVNVYMPVSAKIVPFDERALLPASPDRPEPIRQERMRQVFEVSFDEPVRADLLYPQTYLISEFFFGGLTEVIHESGEYLYAGTSSGERMIEFPTGKSFVIRNYNQVKGSKLGQTGQFPLVLQREIGGAQSLPVYENLRARFTGSPVEELNLTAGDPEFAYIQDTAIEKLHEIEPRADFFTGKVAFTDDMGEQLGESAIVYYAGTPLSESTNDEPTAEEASDDRAETEKLADTLFDSRLGFVRNQRASEDEAIQDKQREFLEALIAERPDDPEPVFEKAVLLAIDAGLAGKWWKGREVEEADPAAAEAIMALLEKAIELVDPDAVAASLGAPAKAVPGDVEARHAIEREQKEIGEKRQLLVTIEQLRADVLRLSSETSSAWQALAEVARWEETPGEITLALQSALYEAEELYGLALQAVNERLEEKPLDSALLEQRIELYRKIGWYTFADEEARALAIRKAYQSEWSDHMNSGG